MLFAKKKISTPPGAVGVIFIRGPRGHFGAVIDVAFFCCFFFQNWLEMIKLDKIWTENNFSTLTQLRAGCEGHFYEWPGGNIGVTLDIVTITYYFCLKFGGK